MLGARFSSRDLAIAVAILGLTPGFRWVGKESSVESELGATIVVALAIVAAFVLVAFLDWAVWNRDTKEVVKAGKALRQLELLTGRAFPEVSRKPVPRGWWRPLYRCWLRWRYGGPNT